MVKPNLLPLSRSKEAEPQSMKIIPSLENDVQMEKFRMHSFETCYLDSSTEKKKHYFQRRLSIDAEFANFPGIRIKIPRESSEIKLRESAYLLHASKKNVGRPEIARSFNVFFWITQARHLGSSIIRIIGLEFY